MNCELPTQPPPAAGQPRSSSSAQVRRQCKDRNANRAVGARPRCSFCGSLSAVSSKVIDRSQNHDGGHAKDSTTGQLRGNGTGAVAIDILHALATRMGIAIELVGYPTP